MAQSEVARLLDGIEAEYVAACRGLSGLAEVARHTFVTKRMERIQKLHEELRNHVGNDAIGLIAARLDQCQEEVQRTS